MKYILPLFMLFGVVYSVSACDCKCEHNGDKAPAAVAAATEATNTTTTEADTAEESAE